MELTQGYGSPYAQTPPQSLEAERSVLGALMQDYNALTMAMEQLRPEDFYQPQHAVIYKAMQRLFQQPRAVDLVTMDEELTRAGALNGIGGTEYLIDLIQFVPSTANVRHYIDIVLEKSTLRKLIQAAAGISQNSYAQQMSLEDVLLQAEKSIFDIVMQRTGGEQLEPVSEVLKRTYALLEELDKHKGQIMGVPTGFTRLDRLLTGLHGGELILVGARPSMGKTSFAINIATHAAHKGKSVAVFSLEMPREQIALRALCGDARVDMQRARSGSLKADDWIRLAKALAPMSQMRLYIDDTSSLTPAQLRSRCRRLMMEKGLDLVVIDYMQLMSADGRTENRQLEVSEISRKLKGISLELKVPVMACAQLSRANVQRASKKPMLSDLRDSGSIEQDADVVMFLHRESYYDETSEDTNTAEVIVAKQRNGPLDTILLNWLDEFTLFEDRYEQGE
ncbi:MAG: replicative DNA helicase [Christensenellales bacterium]